MKKLFNLFHNSKVDLMQLIKLVVFTLLVINYIYYFREDWLVASHTMRNGGSFLDWTGAFATTIDDSAWLMLIILFELETYILSYEPLAPAKRLAMQTIRIICYFSLTHTFYVYLLNAYDLSMVTPILDVSNLCQLVNGNVSFTSNLLYTELNAVNCHTLSTASQFFYIEPPNTLIVTDNAGFIIAKELAWFDLMEISTWMLIILTIEIIVRLQERNITRGTLIKRLNITKFFLYSILWIVISYWIYRGHWVYAWDEFVWIVGFMAIEMNVVEWRDELDEHINETTLETVDITNTNS